jgi:hypothetical protein
MKAIDYKIFITVKTKFSTKLINFNKLKKNKNKEYLMILFKKAQTKIRI